MVTDTATRVTGTALGACFYNVVDEAGELQVLSAFSGASDGDQPVRSFLAVPLRARDGHVLGGLFFGHPEPGRFTETDEQIVVGIASQASIAIDNARLYELEREARTAAEISGARLGLFAEATKVLTSSLEVDVILSDLARLVTPHIADACLIDLVEDDGTIRRVTTA